jgi:hypothetical protein
MINLGDSTHDFTESTGLEKTPAGDRTSAWDRYAIACAHWMHDSQTPQGIKRFTTQERSSEPLGPIKGSGKNNFGPPLIFPWSVERQSVKRGDAFELRTLYALMLSA